MATRVSEMPDIQKIYETVPAYEMIKIYVVQTLTKLNEEHAMLQKYMLMGRKDSQLKNQFKADVLNFYIFLRPKIYDIQHGKNKSIATTYSVFTEAMNHFVMRPHQFDLSNSIVAYQTLVQFCEDYRLTATTFWTGTTQNNDSNDKKDVMEV